MSKKITKKQHYVPQFLLKGFNISGSGLPKVNIFDISRNHCRFKQSIKDLFSQNYFYDKDNEIEGFISQQIENPAANIINAFRHGDYSLLNNDDNILTKFFCCQNSRTVEAREDALNFINASVGEIVADYSRLNELDLQNPKGFRIVPKGDDAMRNFIAGLTLDSVIDSKGMEDLKFHILRNNTQREFVISDQPVGRYNWFYREMNDPRIGNMLARGVQLFMPLSKNLYLCAYDSKVYKYGDRASNVSEITNAKDVDWLNELQVRGAHSFIAFASKDMATNIQVLHKQFSGRKIYKRCSQHSFQKTLSDGNIKTGHLVYSVQASLSFQPTFFKVLKKARVFVAAIEERNPLLGDALMKFKKI